ncbi:MAG TPA: NAD(P)H-dependent oxidoreductase [Steroidobacteraceae bacterium]|nr:NAD(P)H-dependent oxidoreductase [Steroidobacteraceae bacterium]
MRVFIVHAHHEPKSFNGALTRTVTDALTIAGHDVQVSDLYAMQFDPVSDRRNFRSVSNGDYLKQQSEETYASEHDSYVTELQLEMDKLVWCDTLIFQFPLWWLGMPAILKGWVDRVFAVGRAYGGGRYLNGGVFSGKRAMCSMTVGGSQPAYTERGIYDSVATILHPIHRGILGFAGFTVVEPFVVYAPARISQEERADYLARYVERVLNIESAPTIAIPNLADYDGFVRRTI